MKPIPITIRGVTYPSKSAAARALSVRWGLLWRAEREGWLHTLGLGKQLGRRGRLWLDDQIRRTA